MHMDTFIWLSRIWLQVYDNHIYETHICMHAYDLHVYDYIYMIITYMIHVYECMNMIITHMITYMNILMHYCLFGYILCLWSYINHKYDHIRAIIYVCTYMITVYDNSSMSVYDHIYEYPKSSYTADRWDVSHGLGCVL